MHSYVFILAGRFTGGSRVQFIHAENGSGEKKKYIVCVDPGHGGTDPGKVGINGQLEKDINLAIAKKLKTYLEASDVTVVLTVIKTWGFILLVTLHKKGGYA